ncbi:CAP domain-containing protein [Demequina subtropica]|uniref:CAP domain-containing protein n=1 Tax=Demequina subtropica TaxID=1638989 RepID=UPI000781B2CE|nr:CAP domain-containing protein [Demequina subtropica]
MRPVTPVPARRLIPLASLVALVTVIATTAVPSPPADAATSAVTSVLDRTNSYRASKGLAKLRLHPVIEDVAVDWSSVMRSKRSLAHNPRVGVEMPDGARASGENVGYACGYGGVQHNANAVMSAWLQSSGHRANILGKYTDIGIGITYDSVRDCVWATQDFGRYTTRATAVPLYKFTEAPRGRIFGTPAVGRTLTAAHGDWSPNPDRYLYRWYRDGVRIVGATDRRYTVTKADKGHTITLRIYGQRDGYQTTIRGARVSVS